MKLKLSALCAIALSTGLWAHSQQVEVSPVPQQVQWGAKAFNTSDARYYVSGDPDSDALRELASKVGIQEGGNVPIIVGSRGDAAVAAYESLIPEKAEGYYLKIEPGKVIIAGNDAQGTFYGVKTFLQIASQPEVMSVTVTDWPLTSLRGVVEGFYGNPWSHEDRQDLFRFYGDNKMNIHIYGPKNDPYHHSRWYELYPEEEAAKMAELVKHASENKVRFVWAMHPSNSIASSTDRSNALKKFDQMYSLGVRDFAIFFDDISAESVDNQISYLNFLTTEFVNKHDDVAPMIVCPTQYNRGWSSGDYLSKMGSQLDPGIRIMWTGNSVVDMIDKADCAWFKGQTGRDPFIWLNYPVNDYGQHNLLMGPVYGNEADIYDKVSAFTSNPMQYAEASKVALYSIADYCWNPTAYDSDAAWERSFAYLVPGHEKAYRTFCINNVDVAPSVHGLRRYNESPEFKAIMDKYPALTEAAADEYAACFNDMKAAADELLNNTDQPRLTAEILEFLQYFNYQAERGLLAMNLFNDLQTKNVENFISHYRSYTEKTEAADKLMSRNFTGSIQSVAPRTATLYVEPFIKSTVGTLVSEFKSSGFDYPSDLFPAQVLENGTYYIMHNGKYLSNPSGSSNPVFQASIDDINPGRQQWIISVDPETGRYKIVNEWDKRYLNELGNFTVSDDTNPYEAAWHSYKITRLDGKFAIQNGGSAGNNYWTANATRISKGSVTAYHTDNFIFDIVPADGSQVTYPSIIGKELYIIDEQGRALTGNGSSGQYATFKTVKRPADKNQLFLIEGASSVGRLKVTHVKSKKHFDEVGRIGFSGGYSDVWNTFCITEVGGLYSIQNAAEAGTDFWLPGESQMEYKNTDISDSYRLRLIPEDEYTGIGEITDNTSAQSPDTAVAYDLAGRRVSNPRHGFYIVNGEKMIMQ